jgi:hypothetical protein
MSEIKSLPRKLKEDINKKAKLNFSENVLTKIELKRLFLATYYDTRIKKDNIGFTLENVNNRVCYTISSYNIILRLQYILYNGINNLVEKGEIIRLNRKIQQNECLTKDESDSYNKYLVIQSLLEFSDIELVKKIARDNTTIFTKEHIYEIRMAFIRKRLLQLTFYDNYTPNLNTLTKKYLLSKLKDLENILNDINGLFVNETLYESFQMIIFNMYYIGDTSLSFKLNYFTDNATDINHTARPENLDLLNEIEQYLIDIDAAISNATDDSGAHVQLKIPAEYNTLTHEICALIAKYRNRTLTIADFPPNQCINNELINLPENKKFLLDAFGLSPDGELCPGGSATFPLQALIDIIDNTNINDIDSTDTTKYIINNKYRGQLDNFIALYDTPVNQRGFKKEGFKIVGLLLNCGQGHSISAQCYGSDCDKKTYTIINDDTRTTFDIKDSNASKKYGKLCNFDTITIETIVYEPDNLILKLKKQIDNDILYIMDDRSPIGNLPYLEKRVDFVHGGDYYQKYLKYKSKYLQLKNIYN